MNGPECGKQQKPLYAAMGRVEGQLERQRGLVDALCGRLEAIMRPEQPEPSGSGGDKPSQNSPLVSRLDLLDADLCATNRRLEVIMERLET